MKLSPRTVEILKNFNVISSTIMIKPGNKLSVMHNGRTVAAFATVSENFLENGPDQAPLQNYANIFRLFNDPDLEFKDTHILIRENNQSQIFKYCHPDLVLSIPTTFKPIDPLISFKLTHQEMSQIEKASKLLNASHIIVTNDGKLTVTEDGNDSINDFSIDIGAQRDVEFRIKFKRSYMTFIKGDYQVDMYMMRNENYACKFHLLNEEDESLSLDYIVTLQDGSFCNV